MENRDKPAMKVLDLFSGIGGFSLGLERAGFPISEEQLLMKQPLIY